VVSNLERTQSLLISGRDTNGRGGRRQLLTTWHDIEPSA